MASGDDRVDPSVTEAAAGEWLTKERAERLAILVISLTAVLTAWTTYQSAKWNGEQTAALAAASVARAESESFYNDAREEYIVDAQLFTAWLDATVTGRPEVADALRDRFPPTLAEAFEPWIATNPLESADAPPTPFEEYDYEADEEGNEQYEIAEARGRDAAEHNQQSDEYTAMAIVFATVILFAALSDKIPGARSRWIMLTIATGGLIGGVGVLLTFPVVL